MGEHVTEVEQALNSASSDTSAGEIAQDVDTHACVRGKSQDETVRGEANSFAAKLSEIAERLARSRLNLGSAVWDGELRKHLQRIADRLETLANTNMTEPDRERVRALCLFETDRLDLDSALALSAKLDELVAERGDEATVCAMLENEFQRTDTAVITWRKLYGAGGVPPALVEFRAGRPVSVESLKAAQNELRALFYTRYEDYTLLRTRQAMKGLTFLALAPVVLVLVIGLGGAVVGVSELGWSQVLLVSASGALGAVLGGTFKLRDAISRINDLRAFRHIVVVQSLAGAAFGLLLLLALEAGVLSIGSSANAWAQQALVGFAGGFSEPFSLRLVEHVSGLADPPTADPSAASPATKP